jgi:hypothetical protein
MNTIDAKRLLVIWILLLEVILIRTNAMGDDASDAMGMLEGKVFVGHTGPLDGPVNGEDEVVFRNSRFLSTACDKWGFDSAVYKATVQPDGIHFTSVTKSPKHGQIFWKGVVSGDAINATYLWTKERWYWFDAREERWFKGKLRAE